MQDKSPGLNVLVVRLYVCTCWRIPAHFFLIGKCTIFISLCVCVYERECVYIYIHECMLVEVCVKNKLQNVRNKLKIPFFLVQEALMLTWFKRKASGYYDHLCVFICMFICSQRRPDIELDVTLFFPPYYIRETESLSLNLKLSIFSGLESIWVSMNLLPLHHSQHRLHKCYHVHHVGSSNPNSVSQCLCTIHFVHWAISLKVTVICKHIITEAWTYKACMVFLYCVFSLGDTTFMLIFYVVVSNF